MKKGIIYLLFLSVVFIPLRVSALSCDYNEKAKIRKLGSNVTTSYTYTENGDDVKFTVTLTNISKDIYIIDSTTGKRYDYNGNSEISIGGYKPGTKIKYSVYSTKTDCIKGDLAIKYVNLPEYNKYYKDPLCVGFENLSICSKWQRVNYTYDEFVKKMKYYSIEPEVPVEPEPEKTIVEKIFEFITKYYFIIIPVIGLIIFGISYIRNRKNDFDL